MDCDVLTGAMIESCGTWPGLLSDLTSADDTEVVIMSGKDAADVPDCGVALKTSALWGTMTPDNWRSAVKKYINAT